MTVKEFEARLKEFDSRVVISPLSETEVETIEAQLNRSLPEYYRDFLMTIGLKQDVVWGLTQKIDDFDPLLDFLPEEHVKNYFRFGDNGGEDYWLLRNDNFDDHTLYEYEYYGGGEIKSLGRNFEQLLDESYSLLKENVDNLVENAKKTWSVQFSIDVDNVDEIVLSLRKEFSCEVSGKEENEGVSSAGVVNSEIPMTLEGRATKLKKQEYKDWATAVYYFNWSESIDDMNTNSFIKKILNRLKIDNLTVTLVDYGIMTRGMDEDE